MVTATRNSAQPRRARDRGRPSDADTVLRYYEVVLMADADTVHDPVVVTLSYTDAEAVALDPRSTRALDEAFRRAVKVERRTCQVPASRSYLCGGVRFTRERLIEPASTRNANRRLAA